jgi:hypothetical protein
VQADEGHRQEARRAGMGEGFLALVAHAQERGHRWLNLDGDHDVIEGLAVHEW